MNARSLNRIAYPIQEAAVAAGIGRTALYEAIRSGKLTARKYGRRTLIASDDLKAFVENLPAIKPHY
jgi:excisionase family DNA binding protein